MYDTLTTSYTFNCPIHGETHVRSVAVPGDSSSYRAHSIQPSSASSSSAGAGMTIPASSRHEDLDWAPLGLHDDLTQYVNLMTSRVESLAGRARRAGRIADQGGGVAVEPLLLAGGAPAAGVPVGVQPARAGGERPTGSGSRFVARRAGSCR